MAKKDSIEQRSADLRKQAEKRLQKQSVDQGDITPEQARKMLHELQVHQIELEMQNEELLQARVEIEASLEKYSDLYDFAPAGYYTLTDEGIIREVNLTGAALLGENRSSLINRQFDLFVSDKTDFFLFLRKVYESNTNETCEVMLSRKKDNPRYIHMEGSVMDAGKSMGRYCRMSALDITDRRRAEDSLRVSLAE